MRKLVVFLELISRKWPRVGRIVILLKLVSRGWLWMGEILKFTVFFALIDLILSSKLLLMIFFLFSYFLLLPTIPVPSISIFFFSLRSLPLSLPSGPPLRFSFLPFSHYLREALAIFPSFQSRSSFLPLSLSFLCWYLSL